MLIEAVTMSPMANKSFSIWSNEILIVQGGSGGGCHPPLRFF